MGLDLTRTLRGALAGTVAAGVWSAQQGLDKRVFGVPYDDAELLGAFVTRTRGTAKTMVIGHALHLANGAVFGAVYAAASPAVGGPGAARGLLAGMGEHLASWPLTRFVPAVHPVGEELPQLWGSRPAFAQATWRHALFGVVLGVLEERLNPPVREAAPAVEDHASSNGHGNVANVTVSQA